MYWFSERNRDQTGQLRTLPTVKHLRLVPASLSCFGASSLLRMTATLQASISDLTAASLSLLGTGRRAWSNQ